MRSNFSLRTATAVVGLLGLVTVGLGQAVPTPAWTADSATLSGHAAGPVLDTRLSPNGTFVASVVAKAGPAGGLEVRVRNASDGTFLWSADMGPVPTSGLPRIAFSNDSNRLYFSSDADATATFDGQLEARVPATGANVAGFPINDANTNFIKTRVVTSPNGTWYAYQDGRDPTGPLQQQIIVRNTAGNAVYATVNIGGSGVFPDVRDFQFTNNGTDGELIVAQANGDFYRVNLNTGALVSFSTTTGSNVNRVERIPGDTTNFMVAREGGVTLESITYAAGVQTRNYTNAPAGAKRGFTFLGTTTSTGVAYMMGVVGAFNFPTFLRVDTGDLIVQYDVRRTGQPASDSQMNAIAGAGTGAVFFGANGTERVLRVARPEYSLSLSPTSIVGGGSSTGTVTLPGLAPTGGFLVNLSYGAALSGPATVTVPAGASSVTFTVNSVTVNADASPLVTATFPHTFDADPLNLIRASVTGMVFSPVSGQSGDSTTATVTLNGPVTTNTTVALGYSNVGTFTSEPASVLVTAGNSTATVNYTGANTSTDEVTNVTASLNGTSAIDDYTVTGIAVASVSVTPDPVNEGANTTATITLDKATTQNRTINLSYAASGFNAPPATATVIAGNTSVDVTLTGATTTSDINETVTAELFGSSANDAVVVQTTKITGISVSPNPAPNATNTTGTVTVSGLVPVARTVNLTYSPALNWDLAPATVVVAPGASTANFTFRSKVIPAGFAAQIDGALGGATQTASFNVAPVSLEGTQVYPANAYVGQRVVGVVRLASPRASDLTVAVTSSNTSILPNQSVTILAGQTYGTFSATLGNPSSLDRFTTVTLTASGASEVRTDAFIVRPPTNALAAGFNLQFNVGDGLTRNRESFSVMNTTENILQVVVSANTTLVLKSDGTVWSVGQGTFGQHGDGTSGVGAVKTTLTQVPGLPVIRQIASTGPTVLALSSTGQVWAWGQNSAGQTGRTPFVNTTVPGLVPSISNVAQIASSPFASFALDTNGNVWSWGSNASGAGARGAAGNNPIPTQLTTVAGPFVELGVGNQFGFAIHADGRLFGWGFNGNGQLGLGDLVNRTVMTQIPVTNVRQIVGGVDFAVLLRTPSLGGTRQVLTTGANGNGQRGQGSVGGPATTTFASINPAGSTATQVGAGNRHAFFIGAGAIRAWGFGTNGERGDGTFTASSGVPTAIPATVSSSNILAGSANSVSLTAVRSKGRNEALLTDGTTVRTANFRTGVVTTLTGAAIPAGHTVVGGGEVAGSTATGEVITMDGARALFRQEAVNAVLGASTALGVTLGATESLVTVANFDNAGRMDFITVDSSTGAVAARLFNGTTQTGTFNLYTLGANEVLSGVGDFNQDGFQDLLLFNTSTRLLSTRLYRLSVFQSTTSFVNAPLTPTLPTAIPAVGAGLTPVAAAETASGYGYNLVFTVLADQFEVWQMSRLNRVTTGLTGPTIPPGFDFVAFWR